MNFTRGTTQEAVARAVAVRLARLGKKQKWLAAQVGMSESSLSNRLTGRVALDTEDIDQIATALGLTPLGLLETTLAEASTTAIGSSESVAVA